MKKPIRAFGTVQDFADQKGKEARLHEREELLRVLSENVNDFVRIHDLLGRSVYGSSSVERLYGRQPTVLFEFAHPDDLEACQQWWKQAVEGASQRREWRVRDASGEWRWLETSALDNCQNVIKVVRHTASQLTERLHFLGLSELFFEVAAGGNVLNHANGQRRKAVNLLD